MCEKHSSETILKKINEPASPSELETLASPRLGCLSNIGKKDAFFIGPSSLLEAEKNTTPAKQLTLPTSRGSSCGAQPQTRTAAMTILVVHTYFLGDPPLLSYRPPSDVEMRWPQRPLDPLTILHDECARQRGCRDPRLYLDIDKQTVVKRVRDSATQEEKEITKSVITMQLDLCVTLTSLSTRFLLGTRRASRSLSYASATRGRCQEPRIRIRPGPFT